MDVAKRTAFQLASLSEDAVWTLPDGEMDVQFADATVRMNTRRIHLCWYMWWPARDYGFQELQSSHINLVKDWDSKAMLSQFNSVWWHYFDAMNKGINPEVGAHRIKQSINNYYNAVVNRLGGFVASLDVLDFCEVLEHPSIVKITNMLQGLDQHDILVRSTIDATIYDAQQEAIKCLYGDPTLAKNRLVRAIRAKVCDINQVLQIIVCRGKTADMDNTINTFAILRGLGHGLWTLHDTMTEARTASAALALQKEPLAETEYFNRQMQLICSIIQRLDAHWHNNAGEFSEYKRVDCGSKRYIIWSVDRSNIQDIAGQFHILEDGSLEQVTVDSHHLIGTSIKLRTALTCEHPEENTLCATCCGDLEFSLPAGTNVGHFAAVVLCAIISQKVLSRKHITLSMNDNAIEIPKEYLQFVRIVNDGRNLAFNTKFNLKDAVMTISKKEGSKLNDVNEVSNVADLTTHRVAVMDEVVLTYTNTTNGDIITEPVPVSNGANGSSFSHEFLHYIKTVGYDTDEENINIPLDGWDITQPVWQLSNKHKDMLALMKQVRSMVKVNEKSKNVRLTLDLAGTGNASRAMVDFYELIKGNFSINICHLAIIMRATLVTSKENLDYAPPCGKNVGELAEFNKTMELRSLGTAVAGELHQKLYSSMSSFMVTDRPAAPSDEILRPMPVYRP